MAADGARLHAVSQDVSLGGVRLKCQAEWTTGDQVQLQLQLPFLDAPLEIAGHIAWQREEWVGLAFYDLSEEAERALQKVVNTALGLEDDVDAVADAFDDVASATLEVGQLKR